MIGQSEQLTGIESGQELDRTIDLIVVFAVREAGQFVLEGLEPGGLAGNPDLPAFELGRLLGGPVFLGALWFLQIDPSMPGPADILIKADTRPCFFNDHEVSFPFLPLGKNSLLESVGGVDKFSRAFRR